MTATGTRSSDGTSAGSITAGRGRYIFDLGPPDIVDAGPGYERERGPLIAGKRIEFFLVRMRKGIGARPHRHPEEQWIYVLQGTLETEVAGVKTRAPAGSLVYVPAATVHSVVASAEEDVVFLTAKDRPPRRARTLARAITPRPVWNLLRRARGAWRRPRA